MEWPNLPYFPHFRSPNSPWFILSVWNQGILQGDETDSWRVSVGSQEVPPAGRRQTIVATDTSNIIVKISVQCSISIFVSSILFPHSLALGVLVNRKWRFTPSSVATLHHHKLREYKTSDKELLLTKNKDHKNHLNTLLEFVHFYSRSNNINLLPTTAYQSLSLIKWSISPPARPRAGYILNIFWYDPHPQHPAVVVVG